jgi:hypothetical protein
MTGRTTTDRRPSWVAARDRPASASVPWRTGRSGIKSALARASIEIVPHSGTKSALARASVEIVPHSGTKSALARASIELVPRSATFGSSVCTQPRRRRGIRDFLRFD